MFQCPENAVQTENQAVQQSEKGNGRLELEDMMNDGAASGWR